MNAAAGLPTAGQSEALEELRAIERLIDAGVKVVEVPERTLDNGYLAINVVVDCRRPDDWQPLVPLEVSEPVIIVVPPPLSPPATVRVHPARS
jgi:hypothetical protein